MATETEKLQVNIKSSTESVWSGPADSVSSANKMGVFDILPEHANFVTLIDNKPIRIVYGKRVVIFQFNKAVIRAQNNKISIYTHLVHERR